MVICQIKISELEEIVEWRTNSALRKKIHESSRGYLYLEEDHKNALNKFTVRSLSEERNKVLKKLQNRSPDPPDINRLFFAVNIKNGTIATNVFLDEFNASGNKDLNTFLQSIIDTETTKMTALSSFRLKYDDFRERLVNVEANDDIEKTEMFKSMYEEL